MGPGTKTKMLERGDAVLVVRHVPAEVCDSCGEGLYTAAVTERLLEMLANAVGARVQIQLREFSAVEATDGAEESARSGAGAARR